MGEALFALLKVDTWVEFWWVMFGLFGQLLFMGRFIIQWLVSEKEKRSVVPISFWYLSIVGAIVLFAYAVYRQDPVFILGQSLGIFIYVRNLWLIHAERRRDA